MRKIFLFLFFIILFLGFGKISFAQIYGGTQIGLPGHWLEIGQNNWGALGATTPPAGYHPYPAGPLAEVYDYGHDGWTTGAPAYYGDYTWPGTPYEGWGIQVTSAAGLNWAFTENGAITGPGSLTGANTTYVNAGGKLIANWAGTTAAGQLKVQQQTEVDTNASWVVITVKMYNTGATTLNGIYYFRGYDPDNDETYSGDFETKNLITFQNDADHRVGVRATGTDYTAAFLQLCTKDCRAQSFIQPTWPPDYAVTNLATMVAGTSGTTSSYALGTANTGDYGEGLIYNIGSLCAGDSTFVSYAYTFLNTPNGIDSAFPEPTIVVNGVPVTSPVAPDAIYDTFNACLNPGVTVLPVSLTGAATGAWTWSTWTWSPGTGLATTTGLTNSITIAGLPPIITYTITGTAYNSTCAGASSGTCGTRLIYLTIKTCNGATVNSPCLGDALDFNAPGDSTGATYVWLGPDSYTTTVATTQSFTITPSVWADTGTYRVIKTVGGVSDTSSTVVIIHPVPVISGPDNVCEGSTITLTSSLTGTTWTSGNTAIATIGATTGILTGVAPGTVTIDDTLTGCGSSYTVTVDPVAAITGTASLCMGSTTLLSNTVAGGTWFSSNTVVATVNTTGLVSGITGGTSTISYTTAAGCLSTRIVTVNPLDPITGTTTICTGGTSTLANGIAGGTWSSSNPAVATVGLTTGLVTGVAIGTCNITYVTPAGCISTTVVNVIVLTTITGAEVVCQGSTTDLADGGGGGVWTSTNPGVATIGSSSGVVTGILGGTTTITYTAGGSGCYTTAIVTVNPLSPITGPLGVCQYYTTPLADAIPGGIWTSSNTTVATVNSATGLVSALTAGTTTISYTSPAGCLMTAIVTVHPKPAPPVVSPPTYCQFFPDANPLSSSVTSPGTGLVYYGPGVTVGTIFAPTPVTTNPGITNYWITDSTAFGCISDSTIDPVTIIPQPAPPVTSNSTYCQFSPTVPLNFQVDSATGSYLTWYTSATGGTALGGAPTPPNNVATYPSGTTWYVDQTVDGCLSNRSPVTVIIVYKPSFTIKASNNWVCDYDTLSFAYSSTAPLLEGSYIWQLPPGATIVSGADTGNSISVKFDSVYGQHIISLTVGELNNMCSTTMDTQITVIALPTATGYMNPNICVGDTTSLALSSESTSASIFAWYIDGTPLENSNEVNIVAANSNSGGPFSLSWKDTGIHIITVTTTTGQGCKSLPTNDTVDVHALPDATFTFKPKSTDVLCLEDSVEFMANDTAYNDSYLWAPAHGFNNDNKPVIWGKVEETQSDITLTVTDPFGCKATTTQQLDPSACCTVLFPNAFTPNGDGRNDVFRPLFSGYHAFHFFRIVNRWGQTIFESSNSLPAWDGTFNGVPQDIGTYFYYIQYDCGGNTIQAKGDVTLIR